MTLWLLFVAVAMVAVFVYVLRQNTYHRPPVAAVLGAMRAAAMALAGLVVAVQVTGRPVQPNVRFLTGSDVLEQGEPRGVAIRLEKTAALGGFGTSRRVFAPLGSPTTPAAGIRLGVRQSLLRAEWDLNKDTGDAGVLLARRPPRPNLGDNWYWINPFPPETERPRIRLRFPEVVLTGQETPVSTAVLRTNEETRVNLTVDGRVHARSSSSMGDVQAAGSTEWKVRFDDPGVHQLRVDLHSSEGAVLGRQGRSVVVRDPPRVLYFASGEANPPLPRFLEDDGYEVLRLPPESLPGNPVAADIVLRAGDLLIIDDVPPAHLGFGAVRSLADVVARNGAGLLVIPGATRPGEHRDGWLEKILPVRIGLHKEGTPDPTLAFVVVLDISNSMHFPVQGLESVRTDPVTGTMYFRPGGIRKINLAKRALLNLTGSVREKDRLGILGVNDAPHWVVPVNEPYDREWSEERVRRLKPYGGGINLYSALLEARDQLVPDPAEFKHVVLLLDTADVDEYEVLGQGTVEELADDLRAEGISLSIVGFGDISDPHIPTLNRLSGLANGYFYLTSEPAELPGFFLEDLEQAYRKAVIRVAIDVKPSPEQLPQFEGLPAMEGLVLTTLKAGSRPLAWSDKGHPILAVRKLGNGNVGVFAGDSGQQLAPDWVSGDEASALWAAVFAAILGSRERSPELFAWQREGRLRVSMYGGKRGLSNSIDGSWVTPSSEVRNLNLRKSAPFEFQAAVAGDELGAHAVNVLLGEGAGPFLSEVTNVTSHGPARLRDDAAELDAFLTIPPPKDPLARLRDSVATSLMLILALALFALEECFRVP